MRSSEVINPPAIERRQSVADHQDAVRPLALHRGEGLVEIFGLAHAPGFILRHAGLEESIGPDPSPADAIVILSVGGIFFGIVWARTKNLWAVMFIHAATDLLPNLKRFVVTWGI